MDEILTLLAADQYDMVLVRASEAWKSGPPPQAARIALKAADAAGRLQKWHVAAEWAQRGIVCAEGDLYTQGQLCLYAATASLRLNDLNEARRHFDRLLPLFSQEPQLKRLEGQAFYNLALLHRVSQQVEAELQWLLHAETAAQTDGDSYHLALCRYQIGWCLGLQDKAQEAFLWLEAAANCGLDLASDPELEADVLIARALCHLTARQNADALQVCAKLSARYPLLPRQAAELCWIEAQLLLSQGKVSEAWEKAEAALRHAVTDWWEPQVKRIQALQDTIRKTKKPPGRF